MKNLSHRNGILEEDIRKYQKDLFGEEWSDIERKKKKEITIRSSMRIFKKHGLECQPTNSKWERFQESIIINPSSGRKSIWDLTVIVIVFYSCFTSFFWSSFYPDGFQRYYYLEYIVEVFFGIDMLVNFITSFTHADTNIPAVTFKETSYNYLKGTFIFDLIAVFPFNMIFSNSNLRVTQTIRVIRFWRVLDEERIANMINRAVENVKTKNVIQYQYTIRYVYRIFRFILIGWSTSFFLSCIWYIYLSSNFTDNEFQNKYLLDLDLLERAVSSYYFILSTLATVGYGDFVPQTLQERIITMCIMVTGIAFFSYIINNFNSIMKNYYTKLGYINKTPELEEWMLSLNKNADRSMDRQLVKSIYSHFDYFYKHYKLLTLSKDDKYFQLMSFQEKKYMIRHLFQDVFSGKFRTFFLQQGKTEYEDYNFYIDMAFALLPRKYKSHETILMQGETVQEVYLLLDGEIEVFFDIDGIRVSRYFSSGFQFGSVHILSNSLSNFTFKTTTTSTCYAIKKDEFLTIFNQYQGMKQDIIHNVFSSYKLTRKVMIEQFIKETESHLKIKLNEEEANSIFDILNKKLQAAKKASMNNILHKFSWPLRMLDDPDEDQEANNIMNVNQSQNQKNQAAVEGITKLRSQLKQMVDALPAPSILTRQSTLERQLSSQLRSPPQLFRPLVTKSITRKGSFNGSSSNSILGKYAGRNNQRQQDEEELMSNAQKKLETLYQMQNNNNEEEEDQENEKNQQEQLKQTLITESSEQVLPKKDNIMRTQISEVNEIQQTQPNLVTALSSQSPLLQPITTLPTEAE